MEGDVLGTTVFVAVTLAVVAGGAVVHAVFWFIPDPDPPPSTDASDCADAQSRLDEAREHLRSLRAPHIVCWLAVATLLGAAIALTALAALSGLAMTIAPGLEAAAAAALHFVLTIAAAAAAWGAYREADRQCRLKDNAVVDAADAVTQLEFRVIELCG